MRSLPAIGLAFAFVLLLGGCGRKHSAAEERVEDKLTKEQITILKNMAARYQNVTDKKSLTLIQPAIKELWDRYTDISQEFQTLPAENKVAAINAHGSHLEQALAEMRAAKEKAVQVSSNAPPK
jgi:hypothetical protein